MDTVDGARIVGHGYAVLLDESGAEKMRVEFSNLITSFGDEYYIRRAAAGIGTPNLAQPTLADGMKLGTSTAAATKSGAGAALGAYTTGSNAAFTTTHPIVADKAGTDDGWRVTYRCDWAAGVATATLGEVVLVTDAETNATAAAGATISRAVLNPTIPKASGDTLYIVWNHDFLGA